MLGPLGNSVASQGGVDFFLHGLVAFARPLLDIDEAIQEICIDGTWRTVVSRTVTWDVERAVAGGFNAERLVTGEFNIEESVTGTWRIVRTIRGTIPRCS